MTQMMIVAITNGANSLKPDELRLGVGSRMDLSLDPRKLPLLMVIGWLIDR